MEDKKEEVKAKRESIGALWLKTSVNGATFMSGTLEFNGEKVSVTVFKNGYKKEDKHPDFHIYKSEPNPQEKKTSGESW